MLSTSSLLLLIGIASTAAGTCTSFTGWAGKNGARHTPRVRCACLLTSSRSQSAGLGTMTSRRTMTLRKRNVHRFASHMAPTAMVTQRARPRVTVGSQYACTFDKSRARCLQGLCTAIGAAIRTQGSLGLYKNGVFKRLFDRKFYFMAKKHARCANLFSRS
jgi:hypothetical protein